MTDQVLPFRRIAVTGATGQLGSELVRRLGAQCIPLTRNELDLQQPRLCRDAVLRLAPDLLINAAAYTAVDKAEGDEATCFRANAEVVGHIALACNDLGAKLVQISTDYVFGADADRNVPYLETDPPGPINVYGKSKLEGELAAATAQSHLVVRTCGLYSASPAGPVRGRNFCDTMLALAREGKALRVVDDQHCTPTYVPHLVDGLLQLIMAHASGLYHLTAAGATTWFGLASQLFAIAGLDVDLTPITTAEYPTPAQRPRYSVLAGHHAKHMVERRDWTAGLVSYAAFYQRLSASPNE